MCVCVCVRACMRACVCVCALFSLESVQAEATMGIKEGWSHKNLIICAQPCCMQHTSSTLPPPHLPSPKVSSHFINPPPTPPPFPESLITWAQWYFAHTITLHFSLPASTHESITPNHCMHDNSQHFNTSLPPVPPPPPPHESTTPNSSTQVNSQHFNNSLPNPSPHPSHPKQLWETTQAADLNFSHL